MSLDLEGSIRNALERGTSVEDAIKSLVNAGYNEEEVRESARIVNPSVLPMTNSNHSPSSSKQQTQQAKQEQPKIPESPGAPKKLPTSFKLDKKEKKGYGLIVLLVVILLILLLSFAASIIFKEKLVEILTNLFS